MQKAVVEVVEALKKLSKPVTTPEEIAQVKKPSFLKSLMNMGYIPASYMHGTGGHHFH